MKKCCSVRVICPFITNNFRPSLSYPRGSLFESLSSSAIASANSSTKFTERGESWGKERESTVLYGPGAEQLLEAIHVRHTNDYHVRMCRIFDPAYLLLKWSKDISNVAYK